MQKTLLTIIIFLLFAVPGWGAIYYVDRTSEGGAIGCSVPNDNDYDPSTRSCGSGSETIYNTIKGAYDATSDGDTVYIMPGTYTADAEIGGRLSFDYGTVTVRGYTNDSDDVKIEPSENYLAYINAEGKKLLLRYVTVLGGYFGPQIIYVNGGGDLDIQYCKFIDNKKNIFYSEITNSDDINVVFRHNIIMGQTGTNGLGDPIIRLKAGDGDTNGALIANISYNCFIPSASNLLQCLIVSDDLNSSNGDSIVFVNNILGGTVQRAIYVTDEDCPLIFKNNISLGIGLNNLAGWDTIDAADRVNDLVSVDADYNCITNLNFSNIYNDNVPGAHSNDINAIPLLRTYPRPVYVINMIDDSSAIAYSAFTEFQESLDAAGMHCTWVMNPKKYIDNYTAYDSRMKDWLDAGHEIGCHGNTGSSLLDWDDAICIYNNTGTAKQVTISCTTNIAADWNGIRKDYTTWTGTITIGNETPIDIGWDGTGFKTLADAKAEIDALPGWSADVQPDGTTTMVDPDVPAIVLADYSQSIANGADTGWLDADKTEYLWAEVYYGRRLLEEYIRANISGYSSYTVTTYGCSFHNLDIDGMNALKEAGYLIARGNNTITELSLGGEEEEAQRLLLEDLAIYCLFNGGGSDMTTSPYNSAKIAMLLNYLGAFGGVMTTSMHVSDFNKAAFAKYLNDLASVSNINVVSGKEFADILMANATFTGTDGETLRADLSSLFDVDSIDLSLQASSPCKAAGNAGVDIGVYPFAGVPTDFMLPSGNLMEVPIRTEVLFRSVLASPVVSIDPTQAIPLGFGSVANDGSTFSLAIAISGLTAPCDLYLGLQFGTELYLFGEDNVLYPYSSAGLCKWRAATTGRIDLQILEDFPVKLLPAGTYNFYFLITPEGFMNAWVQYKKVTT